MSEPRELTQEDMDRDPWLRGKRVTGEIAVRSLVSFKTDEPMVQLAVGDQFVTMNSAQATEQAMYLLGAAHAAQADAFIFAFAKEKLELTDELAAGMVRMFRDFKVAQAERADL